MGETHQKGRTAIKPAREIDDKLSSRENCGGNVFLYGEPGGSQAYYLQWHVDYVHFNPVKHGHVQQVGDCPHSTSHRYALEEIYPTGRSGEEVIDVDAGEIA
jgi:hypothetical protein